MMREYSCSAFHGTNDDNALNWSQEKLVEAFKQSNCLKNMGYDKYISFSGDGWSRSTFNYDKQNPPKAEPAPIKPPRPSSPPDFSKLPESDEIPDGRGMDYFYGRWQNITPGGPKEVMQISADRMVIDRLSSPGEVRRYRILEQGPDHVLAVVLVTVNGTQRTEFELLKVTRGKQADDSREYKWFPIYSDGPRGV